MTNISTSAGEGARQSMYSIENAAEVITIAAERSTRLGELASYMSGMQFEDLPLETVQTLKLCTLDTIGCLVGGLNTAVATALLRMVELGPVTYTGPSAIAGSRSSASPETAALVQGTIAHALIFDDMHRTAKIHPGVFTVPSMLALNDCMNADGTTFLTAVAAGYETASRIGIAINMSEHRKKGWRATSTVGSLGAAMASSRLLGLSARTSHQALAAAAAQASGTFAFAESGGMELYFAGGTAARNGVVGALLAQAGFSGARDPLEAKDGGLFHASSADTDGEQLVLGLGKVFRLGDVCIKMRPTCHSTQTAIDAALELRTRYGVRIKDIAHIVVDAGEITRLQCGWEYRPASPEQMVFHMGFILASVIETGTITSADLQGPLLHDAEYVRIAKATEVRSNDELTAIYSSKKPCVVHLHLKNGEVLTQRVDYCKGDPENFPTDSDIIGKFRQLCSPALSNDAQNQIIDMVLNLEEQRSTKPITALLAKATRPRAEVPLGQD